MLAENLNTSILADIEEGLASRISEFHQVVTATCQGVNIFYNIIPLCSEVLVIQITINDYMIGIQAG